MATIGAMDEDLGGAIRKALTAWPAACAAEGKRYSWDACTDQFVAGLSLPFAPEFRRAA